MRTRAACSLVVFFFAGHAAAQWNPPAGQWGKTEPTDVRIMTWNIQDALCRTNSKTEDLNDWCAIARVVAALKPDILLLQECGDNSGQGTGSGVDSVAQLTTVMGYFFNGGLDSFKGNTPITSWVKKYDPNYGLDHVYVSAVTDNFNRNVLVSRWPFQDLNGDNQFAISNFAMDPDLYAPGGAGGIRGIIFAEINLPDSVYAGDIVAGTMHMRSGGSSGDLADRLAAGKNIAYYIDYLFNGGGTLVPDPRNKIFDAGVTSILGPNTPVVWGGDANEDENTNGRDGPVHWMARAQVTGGTDGTDRDRSDSTYDDARDPFNNNRSTFSSSKLDYMLWQDSIATLRRAFIFNSGSVGSNTHPPECIGYPGSPALVSSFASDHRPVIIDLILPLAVLPPGSFTLNSPADGSVGVSLTTTLEWSASAGAADYSVVISQSPSLFPVLWSDSTAATSIMVPPGVLQFCTEYYWGVTANNSGGSTPSSPASWMFESYRPADFDGSGFVDIEDYTAFVLAFEEGGDDADFDGSGFVDIEDFSAFVLAFEEGC